MRLPEAPVIPPKVAVVDDLEMVEIKSNNSSPVHSKTTNPRKRHLQNLLDTAEVVVEQPPPEIVTIPEKKKRETIEVVSVAWLIVKSSIGSAKIVGRKESPAVAKKNLAIKSTTITINPPLDQLSPTNAWLLRGFA